MNVIGGQIPSGFAIDEVRPASSRLWHRREVRPRSESDLHQTSLPEVVLPNVREPVYRAAEENGFPFSPHTTSNASQESHDTSPPDTSPKSIPLWLVRLIRWKRKLVEDP